jgi:hypothetical protein
MNAEIFIGWDSRQRLAWKACARSILSRSDYAPPLRPLGMEQLRAAGLYQRPTTRRADVLWDLISDQPMSTEFSLARFWAPLLAQASSWALFVDCDFLFRADVVELFELADPRYAVMVVKQNHAPAEGMKMDGQVQTAYPRKNWSSLMLWNMAHAGTRRLTLGEANTLTKHSLHGFSWLKDSEIGELPPEWNWLEGYSDPGITPKAVHFTRGTPDMPGYERSRYADEWMCELGMDDYLNLLKRRPKCLPENFGTA